VIDFPAAFFPGDTLSPQCRFVVLAGGLPIRPATRGPPEWNVRAV